MKSPIKNLWVWFILAAALIDLIGSPILDYANTEGYLPKSVSYFLCFTNTQCKKQVEQSQASHGA